MRRWLFGLFIFSLILRLASSAFEMFWYDELIVVQTVKLPFFQLLAAVKGDVHTPTWYVIEWIFAQVAGRSPFVMRLPAALFSSASVAQLYLLVRRVGSEKAARLAGGLMSILPAQIYYGEEARMYSLLTLFVLVGARAVLDRNWLRAGLAIVLIPYVQTLGFIYSGVLAVWALWASKGQAFKYLAITGSAYLAWLPVMIEQTANVTTGYWIPARDASGMLYYLAYATLFVRLPEWLQLHGVITVMALTLAGLIGIVISRSVRRSAPLLALGFLPPVILFVASQLFHPVLLDRALLPAGTIVAAIWAIGYLALPGWSRKLLGAIAVPVMIVGLVFYYIDPTGQRATNDPVIDIVREGWQSGDILYHINQSSMITYDYYLPEMRSFGLPEKGDLQQSLTDATQTAMGLKARQVFPDTLKADGYKRAWVFIWDSPVTSDYETAFSAQLLASHRVEQRWDIYTSPHTNFSLVLVDL